MFESLPRSNFQKNYSLIKNKIIMKAKTLKSYYVAIKLIGQATLSIVRLNELSRTLENEESKYNTLMKREVNNLLIDTFRCIDIAKRIVEKYKLIDMQHPDQERPRITDSIIHNLECSYYDNLRFFN